MSEIEVPLEKIQEELQHSAMHGEGEYSSFINKAALLSAFLAGFAAVSALFAGHYANEAMIGQIQASDSWSHYQAKSIKMSIAELKQAHGLENADKKVEQYKKDQEAIKAKAEELEHESREFLQRHERLAASVTLFQIAIALTAIAALTRKKTFLYGATILGLLGVIWLLRVFIPVWLASGHQ